MDRYSRITSYGSLSPAIGGVILICVSSNMNRINHTALDDEMKTVKKNTVQSKAIYEKQGDNLKCTTTDKWDGLPVRVRGASPNKSFATAITWSDRSNTSCKWYWSDKIWKYSVWGNISYWEDRFFLFFFFLYCSSKQLAREQPTRQCLQSWYCAIRS